MAIIGPDQLPVVLQVDSMEIKKYVLSQLGHPVVSVELTDDQFEMALRVSGDFIATYFPKESRLAYFYTVPLQGAYDLPTDAYWVTSCHWDPAVTRIGDIFGAESFLFCMADGLMVLNSNGDLVPIDQWSSDKAQTPFGPKKIQFDYHSESQNLVHINYRSDGGDCGELICTPNHPVKVNSADDMLSDWKIAGELSFGDRLVGVDDVYVIDGVFEKVGSTYSVRTIGADCFYGCHAGRPVLIH